MSYEAIATRLPGVGSKRVCVSCATRFYDLGKMPPVCPKCGAEQPPVAPRAPSTRRGPARHAMLKPVPVARDPEEDAAPVLDPDDDEEEAGDDAVDEDEDEEDVTILDPEAER